MRRFLAPVAMVLLAACSSGDGFANHDSRNTNHEATSPAIGQADVLIAEQVTEATTTTESPTTEAPAVTTTVDWGPVLCPSLPHPAHHRPCPPATTVMATPVLPVSPAPAAPSTADYGPLLACIRGHEQGAAGYATDTGNGFYGAYQFQLSTWISVGGSGNPAAAEPTEQDKRAVRLYLRDGLDPWPTPKVLCRRFEP